MSGINKDDTKLIMEEQEKVPTIEVPQSQLYPPSYNQATQDREYGSYPAIKIKPIAYPTVQAISPSTDEPGTGKDPVLTVCSGCQNKVITGCVDGRWNNSTLSRIIYFFGCCCLIFVFFAIFSKWGLFHKLLTQLAEDYN